MTDWMVQGLAVLRVAQLGPNLLVLATYQQWGAGEDPTVLIGLYAVAVAWSIGMFSIALRRGGFSKLQSLNDLGIAAVCLVVVGLRPAAAGRPRCATGFRDRWRTLNAPHLVAHVRAGATLVKVKRIERSEDEQPVEARPPKLPHVNVRPQVLTIDQRHEVVEQGHRQSR